VFQGSVCAVCQCPNSAIAKTDAPKYQSDLSARRADCPPQGDIACSPCPPTEAVCDPGTNRCAQGVASVKDGG
jgi:hypothetical protein